MSESTACTIHVAYGDPAPAGLPVSVGVPWCAGVLDDAAAVSVRSPDGEVRPAFGRALVRWPDGSVRWCLLSFGARRAGPTV